MKGTNKKVVHIRSKTSNKNQMMSNTIQDPNDLNISEPKKRIEEPPMLQKKKRTNFFTLKISSKQSKAAHQRYSSGQYAKLRTPHDKKAVTLSVTKFLYIELHFN